MKKNKLRLFFILSVFCLSAYGMYQYCNPPAYYLETRIAKNYDSIAALSFKYCKKNNMDTQHCMLIDYSLHSGYFRFFLWDFQQHKKIDSGMVSHGCGKYPWGQTFTKTNPVFSNKANSHCSSLGKYAIGKRGYSNWGVHVNYVLNGLDKTNSNAKSRQVVLHSWDDVPETEIYPKGTTEGWGCPAVNNSFMLRIDTLLQTKKETVLLYSFN